MYCTVMYCSVMYCIVCMYMRTYVCIYVFIYDLITEKHMVIPVVPHKGGGSFKNRKPIGEVGCCDSRMAERIH